jgi:hypothetical protein
VPSARRVEERRSAFGVSRQQERAMANDEITLEQRQEIRRLCQEARVPDRSAERMSQEDYKRIVADLKEKARIE